MSNNITLFKVKKLENLVIPVDSFFKHPRVDWHPERELGENDEDVFSLGENRIGGQLSDDGEYFLVKYFEIYTEFSGTFWQWIILPALKESTGEFVASLVWESGDIERVTVKNGQVTEEEIDL